MSLDHQPQLRDVTADTERTNSSIAACWTVFRELLPGNLLIKSFTISYLNDTLIYIYNILNFIYYMMYNNVTNYTLQNCKVYFGLYPSSGIYDKKSQRFGDWICLRPQVDGAR
jgi:hypothetical protein